MHVQDNGMVKITYNGMVKVTYKMLYDKFMIKNVVQRPALGYEYMKCVGSKEQNVVQLIQW